MTDGTTVWEAGNSARITEKCHSRISRLIEKEVEQTIVEARNSAREEAKREAIGIIAEAKRGAEEIVNTARQEAERLITEARRKARQELDEISRRRAMSDAPPRGVPPPFVSSGGERTHHGRMPVFWA